MFSCNASRRITATGVMAAVLMCSAVRAHGQSKFESVIQSFPAGTVSGYVQPLADVLVSNLNLGWAASANIPKSKLGLSLDFVGMGSPITDKQKTYQANTPNGFSPSTFQTATIFGGTGTEVTSSSNSSLKFRGSDGFIDATIFPSAVPQLRIGGVFGTEVIGRYFSSSLISGLSTSDFPDLKVTGFGIRHSISQYFKALPVDVAVSYSYNGLTWGDIVDLDATAIGAQVGKSVGPLALFAGLAQHSGKLTLSYTSTDPQQTAPVKVDVDVKSHMQFSAGAGINLAFLRLFGEASFGSLTTYAAGLRVGF
jgi:uncharacterized protein DUF6588